jgi:hypothetical protein
VCWSATSQPPRVKPRSSRLSRRFAAAGCRSSYSTCAGTTSLPTAERVSFEIVEHERPRQAADEILAAVDAHAADLIILGVRRRSAVGKLILGSTAQRVLLEAACPVLAVKAAG